MVLPVGINADSSTIGGDLHILRSMLERFKEAGFSAVEIPVHGVECILGGKLRQSQTERVQRILSEYPFLYTVHGPDPVNLCDEKDPEIHSSALRASIDFAKAIGARIVVYHGSYRTPTASRIEDAAHNKKSIHSTHSTYDSRRGSVRYEWAGEIERLKRIGEYAEKQGVTVAVENIFRQGQERTYRIDPRLLAEVIGAADSKGIGICFDFGHGYLSAQEEGFSYREALEAVIPHLVHLHIHDNLGIPSAGGSGGNGRKPLDAFVLGEGDLHLPPGWGRVPYEEVLPLVQPAYRGVWMMEIHPRFSRAYEGAIRWIESRVNRQEAKEDPRETEDPYETEDQTGDNGGS